MMKLSSAPLLLPELKHQDLQTGSEVNALESNYINNDITSAPPKSPKLASKPAQGAVKVFGSTFFTIFLAEFGDKTQLSTLLMSAESQSPWVVFLGAASALVTTSLLGVVLGQWLATRLAPRTLEKAAGVSMLLIALMLVWDLLQF